LENITILYEFSYENFYSRKKNSETPDEKDWDREPDVISSSSLSLPLSLLFSLSSLSSLSLLLSLSHFFFSELVTRRGNGKKFWSYWKRWQREESNPTSSPTM
jgi:hypothetical protein